jgi:hypothetical protein
MVAPNEGATVATRAVSTPPPSPEGLEATTIRRCAGSARYGIEPHDASVEDFPSQPSQKDGLGRMCKVHWRQYTLALARNANARKAASAAEATSADAPPAS